jgi:hypothetical protein
MRERHRERQLDLLALSEPKAPHVLPQDARSDAREALRVLLIEVIVAERGEENGDEQDQR